MSFPRTLAVTEVASPQKNRNYDHFQQRIATRLCNLDRQAVTSRIPEAITNIKTENGQATISLQAPIKGATTYDTTDGSNPQIYGNKPFKILLFYLYSLRE